ncbi:MAG TPA: metallophosphoesterase [Pseudomonas xinjiangensis]|uniref:Phosphoesterase n=2 Tax=root TaxID=1 RepID=A0A7V1BLC0_9GAMM|nr:metallophosphoesterase [Halopseudomonas xinjiangensis]HEC47119.1 metallophosphoesterase [Halopseudomonas xinjiangensis]
MLRVGLISDTHGLLRPEAKAFLKGCDHIIHAGDIMDESILEELAQLAPVTAVRGNNDQGDWADKLSETELIQFEQVHICVIHDLAEMNIESGSVAARVVVSGHSHKPSITENDGVLYVNPGSAGPRRFKLPVAVAELSIDGDSVSARLVELDVGASAKPSNRKTSAT